MAIDRSLYPDDYFDTLHKITLFAAPARKWVERDRDILSLIDPAPDRTVLDLGSARGDVCFLLAPHCREVIGLDASPRAVELAEEERLRRGVKNVRFLCGDVEDCAPIADRTIDVAAAMDLFEHVDDETVRRMLRALERVLKPGGYLAAYTPNREHYVERLKAANFILKQFPQHIAVRRPAELRRLFQQAGWRIDRLSFSPAPFPFVRHLERQLSRLPLLGRMFRYRILLRARPPDSGAGGLSRPPRTESRTEAMSLSTGSRLTAADAPTAREAAEAAAAKADVEATGAKSSSPNTDVYDPAYYAQMYHRHWFTCPARKWREREENLLELVRPTGKETLLDLGCARGDASFFFAPRVARVIGLDGEPLAISLARERAERENVGNVTFLLADAGHFPEIPDSSIDVAGAFDFLEHVTDHTLASMLSEARRVLRPGGRFAAYTPNREHLVERFKARNLILRQQPDHIAVRRPAEIVRFLEDAGFRIERIFYPASPYPLYRFIDLALKGLPGVGRPFRFRICLRAVKL
jgi:2-polyprenyl-6-hydroxyphenyl methylase / 3-demethylubiquinone-9 3-methyltransferase